MAFTLNQVLTDGERLKILEQIYNTPASKEPSNHYYNNSEGFYNLSSLTPFLSKLEDIVKSIYGDNLKFSNTYTRIYQNTSYLGIHTDRPGLDVTISLCLQKESAEPWPLYISNVEWPGLWKSNVDYTTWLNDCKSFDLQPGQMVACEGAKYPHWRDTLQCNNEKNIYAFLHWTRI